MSGDVVVAICSDCERGRDLAECHYGHRPYRLPSRFAIGGLLVCALGLALCWCNSPASAVQAGVASVELAICILNTYSQDKRAGIGDGAAVADTITRCATDAATIARVLDASHAAQMRLDSPPPLDPDGGSVSVGRSLIQEVVR